MTERGNEVTVLRVNTDEIMIDSDSISKMVDEVASRINADYSNEIVVVGVLTGAYVFVSDLVRKLKMPVIVDFMQVSSYVGENSTGKLTIRKDINTDIKDRDVLIVEDIVDTGRTLKLLKAMLEERGARSVKICTAFNKPDRRVTDIEPDYNGFTIPDRFIVGYGLDYDGAFRQFPDVRIVKQER